MSAFFESAARQELLQRVAGAWIGTPFAIGASIRGAGVDCVRFAAEVYRECGVFPGYEFPRYTIDGGDHLERSDIVDWLRKRTDLMAPFVGDLAPGDLLVFRIGRGVEHHVGIFAGGAGRRLWSSMSSDGVQVRTLRDSTWGRRLQSVWRPMEGTK